MAAGGGDVQGRLRASIEAYFSAEEPYLKVTAKATARESAFLLAEEARAADPVAVGELVRLLRERTAVDALDLDPVEILLALPPVIRANAVGFVPLQVDQLVDLRVRSQNDLDGIGALDAILLDRAVAAGEPAALVDLVAWHSTVGEVAGEQACRLLLDALLAHSYWPWEAAERWLGQSARLLAEVERLRDTGMAIPEALGTERDRIEWRACIVEGGWLADEASRLLTTNPIWDLAVWRSAADHTVRRWDDWLARRRWPIPEPGGAVSRDLDSILRFLTDCRTGRIREPALTQTARRLVKELGVDYTPQLGHADSITLLAEMAAVGRIHQLPSLIVELRSRQLASAIPRVSQRSSVQAPIGSRLEISSPQGGAASECLYCLSWIRAGAGYCVSCGAPVPDRGGQPQ